MTDSRGLWLCRNTSIEMIKLRGYETTQSLSEKEEEFITAFPSAATNPNVMNYICTRITNDIGANDAVSSICAVHFSFDDKLAKKSLEAIVQDYLGQSIDNLILITVTKLNHSCISFVQSLKNMTVENFTAKEMQFNPMKHNLVPEQKIMDADAVTVLLKTLSCNMGNLPTMLKTDVIARFLGARVNDVMEITRESRTTGKSKYYRVVREAE